jgi:xanthine dehydrogenase small subunit
MSQAPEFTLNGRTVSLAYADPTESLLRWLKRQRLHGTKEGCADGDCGACTVALVDADAHGAPQYQAVNSCLLPLGALPGRALFTVEALADGDALHPVQQALVDCAGSQCGYCTPGFVMSLFAGYYAGDLGDAAFEGNLCRCTGYRAIRKAAAVLAQAPAAPADPFRGALAEAGAAPVAASPPLAHYHVPRTVADALALKARQPDATWIAGATDLGVALSHGQDVAPFFIALDRIDELKTLAIGADAVRIGAGVSLTALETQLAGVFPALDQMLPWFAGRQVRNRATLGGNLGTASPIGDLLPVLLALDASVELVGPHGRRSVPIERYFVAYRKTARAPDELIEAVTIPRRAAATNAAYKVAKRATDDISIVAAAFAVELDAGARAAPRRVTHARLAYGGVAATPVRAHAAEAALVGRPLDADALAAVRAALDATIVPISDHRASAAYRRALVGNLFAKFAAEHFAVEVGA